MDWFGLARKGLGLLGKLVGIEPGPEVQQLDVPNLHRYANPGEEAYRVLGPNVCLKCEQRIPTRARLTVPPCPNRPHVELS